MSVEQIAKVLNNSHSTGGDRLLLIAMANEAHSDGDLSAYKRSLRWLAHTANMSERSAARCLKNLVELGEVEIVGRGDGRQSSDYRLTIPDDPRELAPARDRGTPRKSRDDKLSALDSDHGVSLRDDRLSAQGGQDDIPGMTDCPPRDDRLSAPSSRSLPCLPGPSQNLSAPNASETPSDLFGTETAARSARTSQSRIDRHVAAFLAKYPPVPHPSTDTAVKGALGKVLKVQNIRAVLASLDEWVAFWTASGREPQYIPSQRKWLSDKYWEQKPPAVIPKVRRASLDDRLGAFIERNGLAGEAS
jgi:hypothetical protein